MAKLFPHVPNDNYKKDVSVSLNYECEYLFDRDILSLTGLTGFENSLAFDENGSTSTKAVYIARDKNRMIGVAGAAESLVNGVWEIGVDVMEEYRNARVGTYLVRGLTKKLLVQNIIPFYSASITNIGSQMVASRCDYIPFWMEVQYIMTLLVVYRRNLANDKFVFLEVKKLRFEEVFQ